MILKWTTACPLKWFIPYKLEVKMVVTNASFVNFHPALSNRSSLLESSRSNISLNPILLVKEVLWHDSPFSVLI